jgi:hypothetical protein
MTQPVAALAFTRSIRPGWSFFILRFALRQKPGS